MPFIHFLNVKDGDCSVIEHISGHATVIDVCNAVGVNELSLNYYNFLRRISANEEGTNGNFNQKEYPTNPIIYMQEQGISHVFRFILTHPDLDHMDGIEAFFNAFKPTNFWDTNNKEEKSNWENSKYNESDWKFYKRLRDEAMQNAPTRLTLYSGTEGKYYNEHEDGTKGGDGLYILAPTPALVNAANDCKDYNDCSYVILYITCGRKILFAGDSHDATWEHILENYEPDVRNVDLLIAPHHGRKSDRDWEFLRVVNPTLTLFGNAPAKHLGYAAWSSRELKFMTNNQAGSVIILITGEGDMSVYVTCEAFAKAENPYTFYAEQIKAHYWGRIGKARAAARR